MESQKKEKYIYQYSGGLEVVIRRLDVNHRHKMSFRDYGGIDATWEQAINYRNTKFKEFFGFEFNSTFFLIKKRRNNQKKPGDWPEELEYPLPSGISIGRVDGIIKYMVVSYNPKKNLVKRKRFSVSNGFLCSFDSAVSFLKEVRDDVKK